MLLFNLLSHFYSVLDYDTMREYRSHNSASYILGNSLLEHIYRHNQRCLFFYGGYKKLAIETKHHVFSLISQFKWALIVIRYMWFLFVSVIIKSCLCEWHRSQKRSLHPLALKLIKNISRHTQMQGWGSLLLFWAISSAFPFFSVLKSRS